MIRNGVVSCWLAILYNCSKVLRSLRYPTMQTTNDNVIAEGTVEGSLVGLLRHRAATLGDRQASAFLPGHGAVATAITYRELDERAMAIGGELQARRLADRVRSCCTRPAWISLQRSSVAYTPGLLRCPYAPGAQPFCLVGRTDFQGGEAVARIEHRPPLRGSSPVLRAADALGTRMDCHGHDQRRSPPCMERSASG